MRALDSIPSSLQSVRYDARAVAIKPVVERCRKWPLLDEWKVIELRKVGTSWIAKAMQQARASPSPSYTWWNMYYALTWLIAP
jgi:hypothetical protein